MTFNYDPCVYCDAFILWTMIFSDHTKEKPSEVLNIEVAILLSPHQNTVIPSTS